MFVLGSRLVLVKYLNSTGFYGSNSYHLMMNLVILVIEGKIKHCT